MITIEGSESIAAVENHLGNPNAGPRINDLKLPDEASKREVRRESGSQFYESDSR